jgi:RNA polymerase sigma-70 factor (ECF subfamily)
MRESPEARLAEIETAYRRNFQRFLHVATAITGDVELGADSVQEAFVRAIRLRRGYRESGSLEGWLWRIVVNSARDQSARAQPTQHNDGSAVSIPSVESDLSDIRDALAHLPERQRLVLFLRYFADLDYESIAAALEITSGAVGATLNKAHAALREHIQEVPSP